MTPRWWEALAGVAMVVGLVACTDEQASIVPTPLPAVTSTASTTTSAGDRTTDPSAGPTTVPPPTSPAVPAPVAADVQLTPVARLDQPIALARRPGDPTVYLAERPGRIRALRDGRLDPTPVLDLSALTTARGERGLLGVAFSPDGRHLYASYTDNEGDSHLDEYGVNGAGTVDATTRRQVLFQEQPYANHNGGGIAFGPDGYLYYGLGDGGSAGDPERRALRLDTWLGKLLRIDPRPSGDRPYAVPADNPFVGRADALPEIWSYGLRNPWRFSFDSANGDLWIADVGQNQVEEVNLAPAGLGAGNGLNFGWSAFEGTDRFNRDQPEGGTVGPVHEYRHDAEPGGCSITGGYVYRGAAIPALRGAYLFADYCEGGVRAIPSGGGATATVLTDGPGGIISFGEGAGGELYVLTLDGDVLRIDPA